MHAKCAPGSTGRVQTERTRLATRQACKQRIRLRLRLREHCRRPFFESHKISHHTALSQHTRACIYISYLRSL